MTDNTYGSEDQYPSGFSLFLILYCTIILFSLNCSLDAPRDNPLDPNLGGNIWGRVLSRNSYGIAEVEVSIPDVDVITYTDTSGDFGLYVLPEDSMYIFFTHDSYSPESAIIVPKTSEIDTIIVELNGLPYFINCDVTTHYYDRNLPAGPLYFCELSTIAGDIDGDIDIDSVLVEIPALSYSQRLNYDPDIQMFMHKLYADELPGMTLEALVGKQIFFKIIDKDNTAVRSSPYYISRIIYQSPDVIFPSGGLDVLIADTTFIWHKYDYGFYVHYHGEIVRIIGGGPAGVASEFDVFAQNDTTYNVSVSILDPGEYYWTLEVIDSFGNSARSKEERFYRD
ncbi:hypothetical protein AMJ52_03635 [candidate division TA06 bacterium DG_78]|uniref:Carboxypeptidase regulatory-like domain-containing protein n=1 Tax=candidate division TA06 bacterium DG_78 TaxID=1703772 RepID=A0A0S7YFZ5_UNCT6|nr:MAG: hypothetical protein AMJ52_03635 [candidate division TA06 bacterium DG_78]